MDEVNFPGWQAEKSIQVIEDNGLTRVLVRGQPYMRWRSGDEECVRLAIVQLYECGLGTEEDLAAAFGRHLRSVQRYVADFAGEGMQGLMPERRGPKGQWKLIAELRGKILLIVLREGIWKLEAIQQRLLEAWHETVSLPSIQQVLEENGLGDPTTRGVGDAVVQGELFGLQQEQQLVLGLEGESAQPPKEVGGSSGPEKETAMGEVGGQEVGIDSRRNYSSAQRIYLDELEQGAYNRPSPDGRPPLNHRTVLGFQLAQKG